jgi:hypothetical protein
MTEVEFLNDALNKADATRKRTEDERDRWRALLVRTVGELNAERMFRDQSETPVSSSLPESQASRIGPEK